ncbi:MAG: HEAT repeat domain-containing protein [Candidatus Heimdallarchaeota archaeon]
MSSEEERISELINAMQDEGIKEHIIYSLGKMGDSALPILEKAEKNTKDIKQKMLIIKAMGMIGRKSVSSLIKILKKEKDYWVHIAAIRTLGRMGKEAEDAVHYLLQILNHNDAFYDNKIRWALREIGGESELAYRILAGHIYFNDSDDKKATSKRRYRAEFTLKEIAEKLRKRENKQLNVYYKTLRSHYRDSAIPILLELLDDEYAEIRLRAVIAFRIINTDTKTKTKTVLTKLDRAMLLAENIAIKFEIALTLLIIEGLEGNAMKELVWMRDNDELDNNQIWKFELETIKQEKQLAKK